MYWRQDKDLLKLGAKAAFLGWRDPNTGAGARCAAQGNLWMLLWPQRIPLLPLPFTVFHCKTVFFVLLNPFPFCVSLGAAQSLFPLFQPLNIALKMTPPKPVCPAVAGGCGSPWGPFPVSPPQ